jgi:hypothetical protein
LLSCVVLQFVPHLWQLFHCETLFAHVD